MIYFAFSAFQLRSLNTKFGDVYMDVRCPHIIPQKVSHIRAPSILPIIKGIIKDHSNLSFEHLPEYYTPHGHLD